MISNNTALHGLGALISALVFATSLLVTTAQAETFDANQYRMLVISDQDAGDELLAGRYADTIDSITRSSLRSDLFSANNNLCVAYVRVKKADKALKACKKAVDRSRRESRRNKAIALSNLGVVRALTGDIDTARHNFRAALRLHGRLEAPRENLDRLEIKFGQTTATLR